MIFWKQSLIFAIQFSDAKKWCINITFTPFSSVFIFCARTACPIAIVQWRFLRPGTTNTKPFLRQAAAVED